MTHASFSVHWTKPEDFEIVAHRSENDTLWITLTWDGGEVTFFCSTQADFVGMCRKLGVAAPPSVQEQDLHNTFQRYAGRE